MLADGSWKTLDFKPFNLSALGTTIDCGTLHPLLKVGGDEVACAPAAQRCG